MIDVGKDRVPLLTEHGGDGCVVTNNVLLVVD